MGSTYIDYIITKSVMKIITGKDLELYIYGLVKCRTG